MWISYGSPASTRARTLTVVPVAAGCDATLKEVLEISKCVVADLHTSSRAQGTSMVSGRASTRRRYTHVKQKFFPPHALA